MKIVSLQSALLAAVLAAASSATSRAQDKGSATFSNGQLQAKIVYCKTCHGLSGQGYRGYLPMPRLAGQQPSTLRINRAPLSTAGGQTLSCLTSRTF